MTRVSRVFHIIRRRNSDTGTLNGAPSHVRRRGAGPTVRNGPIRRSERREREGGATVRVCPVLMRLPGGRRQDNRNDLPLRKTLKRSFPRPCVDRDAPYRRSKLDLEPIHPSGMVTPFGWIGSESSSERRVALMRLPWGRGPLRNRNPRLYESSTRSGGRKMVACVPSPGTDSSSRCPSNMSKRLRTL